MKTQLSKYLRTGHFYKLFFISFSVVVQLSAQINSSGYEWKNVNFGGGGFVTGIITSPKEKNLIYARTDVGGAYRWIETTKSWKPLTDWASKTEWTYFGIESIAIDPTSPNKVYMSAGLYSNTPCAILRSDDYGETFQKTIVNFQINGNGMGRNNGERLAVDPNNGQILFCGSRASGLWKSTNGAVNWTNVSTFPVTTTTNGNGICCIAFDDSAAISNNARQRIFVGVSRIGADNLYVSENGGATWNVITGQPTTTLMPQRMLKAGNYLYITYASAEGPYNASTGAIYQYNIKTNVWKSIAPDTSPYSGITVDAANPNNIMISTINLYQQQVWTGGTVYGDKIYRSTNGGTSWTNLCVGGHLKANVTKHPWIGTAPQLHWVCDIQIDPFNPERVMLTSGNGLFMTENISATQSTWTFQVEGLEETVPLDMVSIPNGPTVTVVGDYNGFIHADPTVSPASGVLKSGMGTTTGVDFAENNPTTLVVCGGPLKYTINQGASWTATATLPVTGASGGSVAVSADGGTIFWYPSGGVNTYFTKDKGVTWSPILSAVALKGRPVTDRVNPNKVYVVMSSYIYECVWNATTSAYTYTMKPVGTASIIRAIPGIEGDVWIPVGTGGLRHFTNVSGVYTVKIMSNVSTCDAIGYGKSAPGKIYPALYIWGTVGGVLGIHRSDDMGETWKRVNDDAHEFGGMGNGNFVMGDRNVSGRVYMSTAGRGLVYGIDTTISGTDDFSADSNFSLYPNPSTTVLNASGDVKSIEIYSLNGIRLLQSKESNIFVNKLQNGCYVAKVYYEEGTVNSLFIKK